MKAILLIIASCVLTGCGTLMCLGTGTCDTGTMIYRHPQTVSRSLPQTVILPTGTYVIVPNQSNNTISSVIQTSRTK